MSQKSKILVCTAIYIVSVAASFFYGVHMLFDIQSSLIEAAISLVFMLWHLGNAVWGTRTLNRLSREEDKLQSIETFR